MLHDFPYSMEDFYDSAIESTPMSAISAVRIECGFVIAADGKQTESDNVGDAPEPDDVQKIFEMIVPSRVLAYAITGLASSDDREFNVYSEAKKIIRSLSTQEFDDLMQFVERFCETLAAAINSAKAQGHFPTLPDPPEALISKNLWILNHMLFVGNWNGEMCACVGELRHDGATVKLGFVFPTMRHSGCPRFIGPELIRMATDPHNPAPRFAKYVKRLSADMSLEEAADFVRSRIEACADPAAANDPACKRVGCCTHIAKVTPDGFSWMLRPDKFADL